MRTARKFCTKFTVDGAVSTAKFSSDARYLVIASDRVTCHDMESGEVVFDGPVQSHFAPQWSHEHPLLHAHRTTRNSVIIDPETGRQISNAINTKYQMFASAFSRNDELLATGGWDYTASIWNVRSSTIAVSPVKVQGVVRGLQFSPDDTRLLVVEGTPQFVTDQPPEDAAASIWRLRQPLSRHTFHPENGRVSWVATTETGDRTVVGITGSEKAVLLDRNLNQLGEFDCDRRRFFHGFAISPDRSRLFVGGQEGLVWCFGMESQDEIWGPVDIGKRCYSFRLSNDGNTCLPVPIWPVF